MLFLNVSAVLYVAFFIWKVTLRMRQYYIARDFLDTVDSIPRSPLWVLTWSIVLVVGLLITFILREYVFGENQKVVYVSFGIDMLMIVVLMMVQNFNYNGLVFWIVANLIFYTKGRGRYISMFLAVLCYVVTDYQLISLKYPLFSLKDYFSYYPMETQQFLLSIYNLLIASNIVIFIIFCVMVIQQQRGVIEEVNTLYSKLRGANEQLQKANMDLHELADVKEKMGQTKERNRLAREIHDTLGHTLTGISAGLDACIAIIDINHEKTKEQLQVLSKVTREGIKEVRRSVNELRPDSLERLNLEHAILEMIDNMKTITTADIRFENEIGNLRFAEDEENTIFRIIQESITNSIRHGEAKLIIIKVSKTQDGIHLYIKDDGKGCMQMKKGFGTKHMIERVHLLNGIITFSGEDGFSVEAKIPIRWGEQYD